MPTDLRYRPRHARRGFQPPSPPRPVRRLVAVAAALVMAVPLAAGLGLRLAGRPDRPHQPAPPRATGAARPGASGAPAPAAPVLHRLRITTHPPGARLVIRTAEGSVRSVRTPFAGRVAEGHVELALTMPGRNRLEQTIDLTKNRSVDLWLDEKGQILHKLGQFSTGPAPKQVAFSPDGSEIWVTDLGGDGIEVFDAHTMKRLADVDLGHKGA